MIFIRISAHRSVLAASSPYFRRMFSNFFEESSLNEILLKEITGEALNNIVNYCYTGKIDVNVDNFEDMVKAVNYLQITHLENIISKKLADSLNIVNCVEIHHFAEAYNLSIILPTTKKFILEHFPEVSYRPNFRLLTKRQMVSFLESDDLSITSEAEVFNALMRWINSNPVEREELISELLPLIRLDRLSIEVRFSIYSIRLVTIHYTH